MKSKRGFWIASNRRRLVIGNAVAVPHTYLNAFSEPVIIFVRLSHPINLGAPDGVPTRFIFVLLGPTGAAAAAPGFTGQHREVDV